MFFNQSYTLIIIDSHSIQAWESCWILQVHVVIFEKMRKSWPSFQLQMFCKLASIAMNREGKPQHARHTTACPIIAHIATKIICALAQGAVMFGNVCDLERFIPGTVWHRCSEGKWSQGYRRHIIWYHIISYHIISYPFISIILWHIMSYLISYYCIWTY